MSEHPGILIIGCGPSTSELADWGFENLPPNIDTFGMGSAYRYFRQIGWWPTYYAIADSKNVFSHKTALAEVVEDPAVTTERFFFSWKVTDHPRLEVIKHASTGDFCFMKSLEMGYRDIYLLGIEGDYVEKIPESREMTEDEYYELGFKALKLKANLKSTLRIITKTPEDNPNFFFQGYQQAGDVYSLPRASKHRDIWNGIADSVASYDATVLNLSQRSKIDAFPKSTLNAFLTGAPSAERPLWYGPFDREQGKKVEEANVVYNLFRSGDLKASSAQSLMVDVGASKGTALHAFAEAGWMVHAFEPNPPLFEALKTKYDADNLILNDVAVSDTAGAEIPFYTSEESTGIGTLKPFRDSHEVTAQVSTIRLDDYLREQSIEHVDFLKIDTEGFDLMVLKGMNLAAQQPEVILCEFEDRKTVPLGYSMHDMADHLASYGYTVYVSEWHPVIQYGIRHQWRALKRYPCELEETDAWGNLIAFKTDPGIWALTRGLSRNAKANAPDSGNAQPAPELSAPEAPTPTTAEVKQKTRSLNHSEYTNTPEYKAMQLQIALNRASELEAQLADVYRSTSWRVTAPIRFVRRAVDRLMGRKRSD